MSHFHVQGAVPIAAAYVSRKFEAQIVRVVLARRSLLLLGPRQHGKSSALIRIREVLRNAGFHVAGVDLQRFGSCEYSELLQRISADLAAQFEMSPHRTVDDPANLEDWLEAVAPSGGAPVVIIVDEASAITDEQQRNTFYGQIRAIKNSAADAHPEDLSSRLLFVFAGTFRWESLVETENSPFNVIDKITTDDLSLVQARELAQMAGDHLVPFVERGFEYVGGQPYLLQRILIEVDEAPGSEEEAFSRIIKKYEDADDLHFQALVDKVKADTKLVALVEKLVAEGFLAKEPADYDLKYLQVVGVTRENGDGYAFSNEAYKNLFASFVRLGGPDEPMLPL